MSLKINRLLLPGLVFIIGAVGTTAISVRPLSKVDQINKVTSNISPVVQPTIHPTTILKSDDYKQGEVESTTSINPNVSTKDPDPPVHCPIHSNCGGGTIPLKQSECSQSVCCGLASGEWKVMSRSECTSIHEPVQSSYNQSGLYSPSMAPLPTLEPFPTFAPWPTLQPLNLGDSYDSRLSEGECRRINAEKSQGLRSQFGGSLSEADIDNLLRSELNACLSRAK